MIQCSFTLHFFPYYNNIKTHHLQHLLCCRGSQFRMILSLREQLAMSAHNFAHHGWGWGAIGLQWLEARDVAKHPIGYRTAPTPPKQINYLAPNVSGVKAEKLLCSILIINLFISHFSKKKLRTYQMLGTVMLRIQQ